MTKEEIMAMKPGKRLNIRVAENIMGYKFAKDGIFGDLEIYPPSADSPWAPLRSYSENKSTALLVIEKLKEDGIELDFNSYEGRWEANVQRKSIYFYYPELIACSVSEAICKAALLAKLEVQNDQRGNHSNETRKAAEYKNG